MVEFPDLTAQTQFFAPLPAVTQAVGPFPTPCGCLPPPALPALSAAFEAPGASRSRRSRRCASTRPGSSAARGPRTVPTPPRSALRGARTEQGRRRDLGSLKMGSYNTPEALCLRSHPFGWVRDLKFGSQLLLLLFLFVVGITGFEG